MSAPDPWMKGFQPHEGVCPRCKRMGVLVYTGKLDQGGNHIYKCIACQADVGAPTMYATCDVDGFTLVKDIFHTPPRGMGCVSGLCPNYQPIAPFNRRCVHFKPAGKGRVEGRDRRKIEDSMIQTHRIEEKPSEDALYERMKAERLKKMEGRGIV